MNSPRALSGFLSLVANTPGLKIHRLNHWAWYMLCEAFGSVSVAVSSCSAQCCWISSHQTLIAEPASREEALARPSSSEYHVQSVFKGKRKPSKQRLLEFASNGSSGCHCWASTPSRDCHGLQLPTSLKSLSWQLIKWVRPCGPSG